MARSDSVYELPDNLPAATEDGACAHLPGLVVPSLALRATDGRLGDLADLPGARAWAYIAAGHELHHIADFHQRYGI